MERNKLCFCGSNIKQKRCHVDIEEYSQAGNTLKLYNQVDELVSRHFKESNYKPSCKSGCAECCYNFFSISEIEFSILLYEIRKWPQYEIDKLIDKTKKLWTRFEEKHGDIVNNLKRDGTGRSIFEDLNDLGKVLGNEFPCIFLDEEVGTCKVYNVRPTICRVFGSAYSNPKEQMFNYRLCSKIPNSIQAMEWQADLTSLESDLMYVGSFFDSKRNLLIAPRRYPILYSAYYHFIETEKQVRIPHFREFFEIKQDQLFKIMSSMMNRKLQHKF